GRRVEEELQAIADEELALVLQLFAVLDVALLDAGALPEVVLLTHGRPPPRSLRRGRGNRIGPDDEDEHTGAVARTADDGRRARGGDDVRGHDGLLSLEQPHLHADRLALQIPRRDFEPSIVGSGQALGGAELDVHLVMLERRVVAVAEELAQSRHDLLEPLVHLPIGRARGSRRLLSCRRGLWGGRVRSLEHPHLEVNRTLWRWYERSRPRRSEDRRRRRGGRGRRGRLSRGGRP